MSIFIIECLTYNLLQVFPAKEIVSQSIVIGADGPWTTYRSYNICSNDTIIYFHDNTSYEK